MAAINGYFCSNLPAKPFPSRCRHVSKIRSIVSHNNQPHRSLRTEIQRIHGSVVRFSETWESIGNVCAVALFAASLCFVDPALAFKGGGPYGSQVTRGQDLTGTDFSGKSLIKQDFKTSILRQTKFKGATLVGASFFDADLTGADLSDADLRGADFSLANMSKANLTNANLEGALATGNTSFKGSVITGADFTDVPLRDDQREYLCKVADGVNPTTGNSTRDTLFCQ